MGHFRSNLRDVEFNLFEVFGRDKVYGSAPWDDLDVETARDLLTQAEKLASGPLADTFASSDRNPPVYDPKTCEVTMPVDFAKSWKTWMDAEFWRLELPAELGGTPGPRSLVWAITEMLLGANPGAHLYSSGPSFAHVLWKLGTPEQKAFAQHMVDRRWGATMVLTEPDAGSDVGAGRTTARLQEDGTWHLVGVKRFITAGEHDMSENIVHLVLARPVGVPDVLGRPVGGPGTKGLSLFLVSKFHVDPTTGEPGERNGVYATNVEHKMGLKVSSTCELRFGEKHAAVGTLVGDVHDGIAQMFMIIESARMMVGTKAISTLSTGYLNALEYAKTRVQGADLTQLADKTAPRVTVIHHPDVRRQLLTLKAYSEGMRALVMYTATIQDQIASARAAGSDAPEAERMNDLLLPIVKGYGSEKSYAQLAEALQVFGGSGYLQDYPMEQYVRDAKIDTLYEGTTAIQGLDLFFRKMVRDQFGALSVLAGQINETVKGDVGNGVLARHRELLGAALDDVQGIVGAMGGYAMASRTDAAAIYKVGANTTRLLFALGDLVVAWLLVRQAEVALAALPTATGSDVDFYNGKIAAARWFCEQVLPKLSVERTLAETTTLELMELSEQAF